VKIWERVQSALRGSRWKKKNEPSEPVAGRGDDHVALATESIRALLEDERVPDAVRSMLASDYEDVRRMLQKLEHGEVHIAAFGRVGVGKSSVLNALLGEPRFSTSALHGETREAGLAAWREERSGGVFLVDTPGIDEIGGEQREAAAREAAARADLLLFVVEGDLTASEINALDLLLEARRPVIVVLNKIDRYTEEERARLVARIAERTAGRIDPANIIPVSAAPRGPDGAAAAPAPHIEPLRERLWEVLDAEGKSLAAMNASVFASNLSAAIAEKVVQARRQVAEKLVRTYCLAKGIAVALNPVPVADLVAAAVVDASMVVHLSRLYNLPLTRREAGSLVRVIATQMAAVMGTVWATHFVSSALKLGTGGMSVMLTAGAQGAVAWYSTYIVGRAAERYFAQGKSWGEGGPELVIREILESVDRDSMLRQARAELRSRLAASRS
jgi:GTP-binding protein Era